MVKEFKERAICHLQRQGWQVKKQPSSSIVDFITTRAGGAKRAFIVKAHGHMTRTEITAIHEYEERNHIGVVYISECSGRELSFHRMYKYLPKGM